MSKYNRVEWLDGYLQQVLEDIHQRLDALEGKGAVEPIRIRDIQKVATNDLLETCWQGNYMFSLEEITAEINRRIFQARQEGYDERRCDECRLSEATPAPIVGEMGETYVPKAETEPIGMPVSRAEALDISKATLERAERGRAEATSETLVVRTPKVTWHPGLCPACGKPSDEKPATLAQVRAEAVRLGLLDTERQKVAEAFLHQALITFAISKSEWHLASASEQFLAIAKVLRGKECYGYADVLERMASVLKAAAKG
jgi:hypothetical protein